MTAKHLPNLLSCLRIALCCALPFVPVLSGLFLLLYLLCGVTDMLDGTLARRLSAQSVLGARLDSAADFLFLCAALYALWPVVRPESGVVAWVCGIAAVRVGAGVIVRIRFGAFGFVHTVANKLSGLALFIYPLFLSLTRSRWVLFCALILCSLSALEELVLSLTAARFDPDRRSVFSKARLS